MKPIRGRAHSIQQRYNYATKKQTWLFRIEVYDDKGNRKQTIQLQMRGYTFDGCILHGDWLEVAGKFHDGLLVTDKVFNITTNSTVSCNRSLIGAGG